MKKWLKGIVGDFKEEGMNCGVSEDEAPFGLRLQSYLRRGLGLTPGQIRSAKFRRDGILVNGVRCRVSEAVYPGDVVEVLLEDDAAGSDQLVPLRQELDILYEDEDILAVNKPAGMVVHPSHGHYQDSLANAVSYYFSSKGEAVRIRAVGRLDKDTSGIVVFARNQAAAARLAEQKEQGIFCKQYTALVRGCPEPPEGMITADLAKDEAALMKMKVCDRGLRAVTHYRTKKSNGSCSAVELSLETGRTHQIRVHMAYIGHPLLGDQLYGGHGDENCGLLRAALHAGSCCFKQPFTGQDICIKAALPEDMERFQEINFI